LRVFTAAQPTVLAIGPNVFISPDLCELPAIRILI